MNSLEYRAFKLIVYAWTMIICAYIMKPVIFLMSLINPNIGFAMMYKFEEIQDDLDAMAKEFEDRDGAIAPVVNKVI